MNGKTISRFGLLILLMFLASVAFGQQAVGSPAGLFGIEDGTGIDHVDLATLAITVDIPIESKPVGPIPLNAHDIFVSSCYQTGAYTSCTTPGLTPLQQG